MVGFTASGDGDKKNQLLQLSHGLVSASSMCQLLRAPSPSGKCKLPFSGSGDFALGQCSNKALSKSAPKFTAKVENVKTERFEFVGYI